MRPPEVMVTLRTLNLVAVPDMSPLDVEVAVGATAAVVAPPRPATAVARVVAGLAAPVTGQVLVGGRDVTDLPPLRRRIGYVPAGGALLPHLTVGRNISYGQRRRRWVRDVAESWAALLVDRLELTPTLGLRPHLLSEAQRFRVALARAMACLPEVLVVDLPTPIDGVRLPELLDRAAPPDDPGVTVLLCSADEEVLAGVSARVPVGDDRPPGPARPAVRA
ncbi:ATP-binding cassette domain-containing protein [Verrucosispora sp. WMMC514]|uniref:ATP-binding cassette domain-containing protein n=1 Tax=Verrucosispora sp. WMMC514 TaxID=3015156 RepID=UPI00248ACC54|nr:ATP-binding cassette domain-containing protein [Verrucosispora sp. WMMC514]WBB90743.1 ATP-binding cassette domain-containing protein [Verrucosispora sp. WMMC514]